MDAEAREVLIVLESGIGGTARAALSGRPAGRDTGCAAPAAAAR
ncbi:hypothetical protein [Streptomyces sannanensis]